MILRRDLLKQAGSAIPALASAGFMNKARAAPAASAIRLSVFTDEITSDFGKAVEIAAGEFGLHSVEVRNLWNKSLASLDEKELAEAARLLDRHKLRISCIASPLFKVDWPGAPLSEHSPNKKSGKPPATLAEQDQLLEKYLELCKRFQVHILRCFDFWRLEDQAKYRQAIDDKIAAAARKAGEKGIVLALENEYACNTGSTSEAARILKAIPLPGFQLLWDPGNSMFAGESPYPDAYRQLPANRIAHVHCKDALQVNGKWEWAAVGKGKIEFVGLFQALEKAGFKGALSLETHWKGGGTKEESTRQSMRGLKEVLEKAKVAWN